MTDSLHNAGPQPLDQIMESAGISNHAVVAASAEPLTHKVVQKARRGRKLTRRAQEKVLRALNKAAGGDYRLEQIFSYSGK